MNWQKIKEMNLEIIREGVDYFIAESFSLLPILLPVLAFIVSMVAICLSGRAYKFQKGSYEEIQDREYEFNFTQAWNSILDTMAQNKEFFDLNFTEKYHENSKGDLFFKYQSFCMRIWSLFDDIVSMKLNNNLKFKKISIITQGYRSTWFERNYV